MFFLFAFICIALLTSCTHLHDMQLWQQVTVRQGHLVAIQEVAVGHLDVLDAVVVDLIGKWRAEVFVQLLQRLQESTLQSCTKTIDTHVCCAFTPIHHKGAAFNEKIATCIPNKGIGLHNKISGEADLLKRQIFKMRHTTRLWTTAGTEPHNHTHAFGDLIDGNNETFAELE